MAVLTYTDYINKNSEGKTSEIYKISEADVKKDKTNQTGNIFEYTVVHPESSANDIFDYIIDLNGSLQKVQVKGGVVKTEKENVKDYLLSKGFYLLNTRQIK